MLKNKKFLGKIQEQMIRVKSKPLIAEVNTNENEPETPAQSISPDSKETNKYSDLIFFNKLLFIRL